LERSEQSTSLAARCDRARTPEKAFAVKIDFRLYSDYNTNKDLSSRAKLVLLCSLESGELRVELREGSALTHFKRLTVSISIGCGCPAHNFNLYSSLFTLK